jgi:hypothetical protein
LQLNILFQNNKENKILPFVVPQPALHSLFCVKAGCAALAASEQPQVLVQHIAGFYAQYFNKAPKTVSFS